MAGESRRTGKRKLMQIVYKKAVIGLLFKLII